MFAFQMQTKPLLVELRPRAFSGWRALPVFGPLLDEFVRWMVYDRTSDQITLDEIERIAI